MAIDVRDPRVQKIALTAIGLGALLYVYFFTTWAPFTCQANAAELQSLEDRYRDLSNDLNKARQASITKEILEVVSGAEAIQ